MKNIFKDWEQKMSAFESSTKKEIEEIKKYKAEMQEMRNQMSDLLQSGRYIRDNKRLILSAPEIIIGNVDPMGVLYNDANSKIVLRGKDVGLQATGEYGEVKVRASRICELAEDPGIDGREHVLYHTSEIVNQARKIHIQSNNDKDAFFVPATPEEDFGVSIVSDSKIKVGALSSLVKKKKNIEYKIHKLTDLKNGLTASLESDKELFKNLVSEIDTLMEEKEKLTKGNNDVRSNYKKLEWLNMELETASHNIVNNIISRYEDTLFDLLETNRLLEAYNTQLNSLPLLGSSSYNESTKTSLTIAGEKINILSIDGDGQIRDNKGAGIDMFANNFRINATETDSTLKEKGKVAIMAKNIEMVSGINDAKYDATGTLVEGTHIADGNVRIQSKNILLESVDYETEVAQYKEKRLNPKGQIKLRSKNIVVSTENAANIGKDVNGKITKGNFTAEGDISIRTKKLFVTSTDYDVEDGEVKEKSLTKDSQLFIRTEKTDLSATETDGKATGRVCVNAKDVILKSVDVNEDDRADKDVASEGSLSLRSNNINMIGDDAIQMSGETIGLFVDDTFEAQQWDGKSIFQLSGANVSVSANMTQVYGDTEVRGELKTPKATIDNLEVNASLKSPNISDGMASPVPSAGKLDTKLEKDELDDIIEELSKQQTEYESSCLNPANWDF